MVVNLFLLCKVAMHVTELLTGVCLGLTWSAVLGVCMALKEPGGPLVVLQEALDRDGGLNAAQDDLSPSEVADNG